MSGLRIVGGQWGGVPLEALEGREVTRPTTDRTREQIASMVLSSFGLDLSEVRVLDAFAGSGALGLEMLSRGAHSCCFAEMNRRAAACVRRNCAKLGAQDRTRVAVGDVFKLAAAGSLAGGPFALLLLDPPYAVDAQRVCKLVEDLRDGGLLTDDARVLYERSSDSGSLALPGLRLAKSKKRGITGVDLLTFGNEDDR